MEDTTTGAFVNDETIVGQTSKATAVIKSRRYKCKFSPLYFFSK